MPGERDVAGGLWHSADRGTHWRKVEGFDSVSSLELRMGSGKELLVVADQSFARVQGDMRAPSRSRVAQRGPQGNWVDSDAPPHGGESEIELCGTRSDGVRHIRVDGTIYRETSRSLFSAWLAPRVPASDAIR